MNRINELISKLTENIIGQDKIIQELVIGFFAGGNVLLEGVPGLGKTKIVKEFSKLISIDFKRIQATPDLLPSDLIGMNTFNPVESKFEVKFGPIFSNIVLVDEINRAPAKLQSALLESMEEKQVTIGNKTYNLDNPFMVVATQNPIEQTGTYDLPEAQLDRFMFKLLLKYPSKESEITIFKNSTKGEVNNNYISFKKEDIKKIKKNISEIIIKDEVFIYISDLIDYTRNNKDIIKYLEYGISTRAGIDLVKSAKVNAHIKGRQFVIPEDIKEIIFPCFRHRLVLNYDSIVNGMTPDNIIKSILKEVKIK